MNYLSLNACPRLTINNYTTFVADEVMRFSHLRDDIELRYLNSAKKTKAIDIARRINVR